MKKILFTIAMGGLLLTSHLKAQVVLEALEGADFIVPSGWNVEVQSVRYLASVYDNNYLPMNALDLTNQPNTAQTDSFAPDNIADPLLNYQGKIGTYPETSTLTIMLSDDAINKHNVYPILIKFSKTGSNAAPINLPAILSEAYIPQQFIKNSNKPEKVYLKSFFTTDEQTKYEIHDDAEVLAYVVSENPLELIQLDMNRGIGKDGKGILLTTFFFSNGATTELRLLPGIPDKYAGKTTSSYAGNWAADEYEHDMFYMPIIGLDNNVWLNNNLGSNYSQLSFYDFNPLQQAKSVDDRHAFGSIFEFLRKADGHELTYYDNTTNNATAKYGETTQVAISITNAGTNKYIIGRNQTYTWYPGDIHNQSNNSQWDYNGENMPCPDGFTVPDMADTVEDGFQLNKLRNLHRVITGNTAFINNNSFTADPKMKFTVGRVRFTTNTFNRTDYLKDISVYWINDLFERYSDRNKLAAGNVWAQINRSGYYGWYHWSSHNPKQLTWGHDGGYIRCIKK